MNDIPLFEGRRVRLAPLGAEGDAEVESRWTHDPDFLRHVSAAPARPLSPGQVKKKYEALEKEAQESHNLFAFALRAVDDDRLIGFAQLRRVDWAHGSADIALGLGAPEDRGRGYGTEALQLLLRYAFDELNLFRVMAITWDDDPRAVRFLERHGFTLEVRRRQAVQRDGRRYDELWLGLLRDEWEKQRTGTNENK